MKLLLICMPVISKKYNKKERFSATSMPYGVLSIATYLKKYASEVELIEIIDLQTESNQMYIDEPQKIAELVDAKNFDMVGISAMFNDSLEYMFDYAEVIKKLCHEVFVFVGGTAASNMYEEILNETKYVDAVCVGEGELPILKMIQSQDRQSFLEEYPAWITHKGLSNCKKISRVSIENIEEIPVIEYDYLNVEEYESRSWDNEGISAFPMLSSRGCPFNCIFCCLAQNRERKFRVMSAERFIEDAKYIVEKYDAKVLSILDDQFLLNTERAKKILRGLRELNVKIEVPSGVSVRYVDEEIAFLMKECGVEEISLAIESGSERMLKEIIDKPLKLSEIKPAVEALRKANIQTKAFFVLGIPGETPKDREDTLNLILETGFDWCQISVAVPFKGSRLYDICIEKGYVDEAELKKDNLTPDMALIRAPHIDPQEIKEIVYKMNLQVNFVNNYANKIGNYKLAESQFRHICDKYPTQAFAHYFLADVLSKDNGDKEEIKKHMDEFYSIIEKDNKWRRYAEEFALI